MEEAHGPHLGPQPNFNNLTQHVKTAMVEVANTPNLPLAGQGGVIVELLQQFKPPIGDTTNRWGDARGYSAYTWPEVNLVTFCLFTK